MNSRTKTTRKTRRDDPRAIARFLEELSWLLSSYSDLDFRAIPRRSLGISEVPSKSSLIQRYAPHNPNIFFLIGALPSLFEDERIFKNNEDIAEFARVLLGVKIVNWEKKSKFELIGHVVCNTAKLSDKKVSKLVHALAKLLGEEREARAIVMNRRQSGLNWNEVIQKLIRDQS